MKKVMLYATFENDEQFKAFETAFAESKAAFGTSWSFEVSDMCVTAEAKEYKPEEIKAA